MIEARIAAIENYLAGLHGEVGRQTTLVAQQAVQQNIAETESGGGSSGSGGGGGGSSIPESSVIWDETEGHTHDGLEGGTPITLAGDASGTNTAVSVDKAKAVDLPTPGAGDDWKLLSYLHSSVDYVLRHMPFKNVTKTADYTITLDDFVIVGDASGGNITLTLPTAASATQRGFIVKRADSSVNTCTLDGDGAETIDGVAGYSLGALESVTVFSTGTAWYIV